MRSRHAAILVLAVAGAAVSLLAAGCGGGSPSPAVANLGSSSTDSTTTTQGGSAPGGSAPSGSAAGRSGGSFGMAMRTGNAANGAKFAACMRSHGVPKFPDPNGQGTIHIDSSMGIDPNSPKFRAAQTACQKLLPGGGQPTPAQQAKMQQAMLKFSACMRAHGVPKFPDPTFSNGHFGLTIQAGPGSGLDPNSPAFQAAQKTCQGLMPGGGPKAAAGSSGGGTP